MKTKITYREVLSFLEGLSEKMPSACGASVYAVSAMPYICWRFAEDHGRDLCMPPPENENKGKKFPPISKQLARIIEDYMLGEYEGFGHGGRKSVFTAEETVKLLKDLGVKKERDILALMISVQQGYGKEGNKKMCFPENFLVCPNSHQSDGGISIKLSALDPCLLELSARDHQVKPLFEYDLYKLKTPTEASLKLIQEFQEKAGKETQQYLPFHILHGVEKQG